jgi:hypothetical protein
MMNKPTVNDFANDILHFLLLDFVHHVAFKTEHNVSGCGSVSKVRWKLEGGGAVCSGRLRLLMSIKESLC